MPQDPAVIQSQIEETRAELAETIDAIAEIVSPKRVAERAKVQIGAKVAELRQKVLPSTELPEALEAAPGGAADLPALPPGETVVRRTVRWDRVVLASGMLLVLVVGAGRRRRRRRAA